MNVSVIPNNIQNISYSQLIGIVVASSALFVSICVFLFLIIYNKYKSRHNQLKSSCMTADNPCYDDGSKNKSNGINGQRHCNISVSTNFCDIDDINSLDNDNFLNNLENAIFEGYHNQGGPRLSSDGSILQYIANSNISFQPTNQQNVPRGHDRQSRQDDNVNPAAKKGQRKTKQAHHKVNNVPHSSRNHDTLDTVSELMDSTSNLITASKVVLGDSSDHVCVDSSNLSHPSEETLTRDACQIVPDRMTHSSTVGPTSVNRSSIILSGCSVGRSTTTQKMPDIINSSIPRTSKPLKRVSSAYSSTPHKNDPPVQPSRQILDPLRVGQSIQFISNIVSSSTNKAKPARHLSYNMGLTNPRLYEYNIHT